MKNPFKKKKEVPQVEQTKWSSTIKGNGMGILQAVKIAANALEKDFIFYDWTKHEACNCGVVVQALLGSDGRLVQKLYAEARNSMLWKAKDNNEATTWREVCQKSCSVTGAPLTEVFRVLQEQGIRPEDIVHLEYLSNKAILEVSGINTDDESYHTMKSNLILYLKAWARILENDYTDDQLTEPALAEAKLLIAASTPVSTN